MYGGRELIRKITFSHCVFKSFFPVAKTKFCFPEIFFSGKLNFVFPRFFKIVFPLGKIVSGEEDSVFPWRKNI